MELGLMTWPELEQRITLGACAMLPLGSTVNGMLPSMLHDPEVMSIT